AGAVVRPRTMCWSEPQMFVATSRRITPWSQRRPPSARSGSSIDSTDTSPGPPYTTPRFPDTRLSLAVGSWRRDSTVGAPRRSKTTLEPGHKLPCMSSPGGLPALSLRQLAYWLVVVEEGSLTTAAKRLAITQPALSQQIRALERTFGGELLERLPTGVRPTPAGRTLLPEARAVLAAAARAVNMTRQALELEPGAVEIATVPFVASGLLFASLSQWHEMHPAVTIRLREFTHRTRLEEAVAAGEA